LEKCAALQKKTSMISTPIFFKNPGSRGFAAESQKEFLPFPISLKGRVSGCIAQGPLSGQQ